MEMFNLVLCALASASCFIQGGRVLAADSSASDDSGNYDFSNTQVKNNVEMLGVSDPISYSDTNAKCIGSFLNAKQDALYCVVFFPSARYFSIKGLWYHIGTETDENGQFLDLVNKVGFSSAIAAEDGIFAGAYGDFYQYSLKSSDDTISKLISYAKSSGFFRINVRSVVFTDDGLTPSMIAIRRNFQGCCTTINLSQNQYANVYENVIVVGSHYEAFQLVLTGKDWQGNAEVQQVHFSYFSFAYDDYASYGQLKKLELSYDEEDYEGTSKIKGFVATNLSEFLNNFEGLSSMQSLNYDHKYYNVDNVVTNAPLTITYQSSWWNLGTTAQYTSNTIDSIADLGKTYALSDTAKKYQYGVIYDVKNTLVNSYTSLGDNNFFFGKLNGDYTDATGAYALSENTNISYIRFWFDKNGQLTSYKAFDDSVTQEHGNSSYVDTGDWWKEFLEWLEKYGLPILAVIVVFGLGIWAYTTYKKSGDYRKR